MGYMSKHVLQTEKRCALFKHYCWFAIVPTILLDGLIFKEGGAIIEF